MQKVNTVFSPFDLTFIFFPLLEAFILSFGSKRTRVARRYVQTVLVASAIATIISKILGVL